VQIRELLLVNWYKYKGTSKQPEQHLHLAANTELNVGWQTVSNTRKPSTCRERETERNKYVKGRPTNFSVA
jgi:hypothetical protein